MYLACPSVCRGRYSLRKFCSSSLSLIAAALFLPFGAGFAATNAFFKSATFGNHIVKIAEHGQFHTLLPSIAFECRTQYVKLGTPLEEADIINRFEIRLRNERAYYAVRDLLTYYDAEQTAFSIINQYVRFVDEEPDKRKNDWKLNDRWAWFIGDNRQSLKLTTKPEPYTLDRTLRWVQRQVAPTLKMLKKIDKGNGTDYMETIEQQAKLTEKHEMIIKQQTTPAKDLIES